MINFVPNGQKKMSEVVLVIAVHPDDETLGCGGTLLRHIAAGDTVRLRLPGHTTWSTGNM